MAARPTCAEPFQASRPPAGHIGARATIWGAGVVCEVGAPSSHAAIVSREIGVPCVVSVTGACDRIADGAPVEIDGLAGTVRILQSVSG